MKFYPKVIVLAAVLVASLVAVALYAQGNIRNPSAVQFTASLDQATIDSYDLDILRPDGTVLQTINLGKPVPDATGTITAPLNVQPIAFNIGYSVRVAARAGQTLSDYAVSTNKFDRVPGSPAKLTLK